MIQLITAVASFIQLMTENPPAMIPKPIIAPTIEWVVETGKDFQVAKLTHWYTSWHKSQNPYHKIGGEHKR